MENNDMKNNNMENNNKEAVNNMVNIYGLVMSCVMAYKDHMYVVFVSSQMVTIKEQLLDKDGNAYEDLIYEKKANNDEFFDANKVINMIPDYIIWYTNNTYGL